MIRRHRDTDDPFARFQREQAEISEMLSTQQGIVAMSKAVAENRKPTGQHYCEAFTTDGRYVGGV